MRASRLAGSLRNLLVALAVLTAFVVLDWYPTVKGLGGLRRERSGWERKIKDYGTMAGNLEFPDAEEKARLANADSQALQALPAAESDHAWFGLARTELLGYAEGLAGAVVIFRGMEGVDSGPPELSDWLRLHEQAIRQSLRTADPLYGVFPLDLATEGRLACQPLGIALQAPFPDLLGFINHVSWGSARLEIVRLRLEPAGRIVRAWLVCRGVYWAPGPMSRPEESKRGRGGEELLVDPDSPLLLRRADPLLAPAVEKRELPSDGSPW